MCNESGLPLPIGLVAQVLGVHEDHAGPGDSRRRRVVQVTHFEEQRAVGRQPDPLAVGQGQEPVVVHDGVHVLDPQGVNVAVE